MKSTLATLDYLHNLRKPHAEDPLNDSQSLWQLSSLDETRQDHQVGA